MTIQELKEMPNTKIKTINSQIGILATAMKYKVMKENDKIVVVTREGLLKYMGNAQYAYHCGVKNKDYKLFKTCEQAFEFINN